MFPFNATNANLQKTCLTDSQLKFNGAKKCSVNFDYFYSLIFLQFCQQNLLPTVECADGSEKEYKFGLILFYGSATFHVNIGWL